MAGRTQKLVKLALALLLLATLGESALAQSTPPANPVAQTPVTGYQGIIIKDSPFIIDIGVGTGSLSSRQVYDAMASIATDIYSNVRTLMMTSLTKKDGGVAILDVIVLISVMLLFVGGGISPKRDIVQKSATLISRIIMAYFFIAYGHIFFNGLDYTAVRIAELIRSKDPISPLGILSANFGDDYIAQQSNSNVGDKELSAIIQAFKDETAKNIKDFSQKAARTSDIGLTSKTWTNFKQVFGQSVLSNEYMAEYLRRSLDDFNKGKKSLDDLNPSNTGNKIADITGNINSEAVIDRAMKFLFHDASAVYIPPLLGVTDARAKGESRITLSEEVMKTAEADMRKHMISIYSNTTGLSFDFVGTQMPNPLYATAYLSLKNIGGNSHLAMPTANNSSDAMVKHAKANLESQTKAIGTKPLPQHFRAFVEEASKTYQVPMALIYSVMEVESGFNPKATSFDKKGKPLARGLMQMTPGTAEAMGVKDPFDPYQSIMGGTRYLRLQLDEFGRTDLALAAYNAGPNAVKKYKGIPPFKETQAYVPKVLNLYQKYTGTDVPGRFNAAVEIAKGKIGDGVEGLVKLFIMFLALLFSLIPFSMKLVQICGVILFISFAPVVAVFSIFPTFDRSLGRMLNGYAILVFTEISWAVCDLIINSIVQSYDLVSNSLSFWQNMISGGVLIVMLLAVALASIGAYFMTGKFLSGQFSGIFNGVIAATSGLMAVGVYQGMRFTVGAAASSYRAVSNTAFGTGVGMGVMGDKIGALADKLGIKGADVNVWNATKGALSGMAGATLTASQHMGVNRMAAGMTTVSVYGLADKLKESAKNRDLTNSQKALINVLENEKQRQFMGGKQVNAVGADGQLQGGWTVEGFRDGKVVVSSVSDPTRYEALKRAGRLDDVEELNYKVDKEGNMDLKKMKEEMSSALRTGKVVKISQEMEASQLAALQNDQTMGLKKNSYVTVPNQETGVAEQWKIVKIGGDDGTVSLVRGRQYQTVEIGAISAKEADLSKGSSWVQGEELLKARADGAVKRDEIHFKTARSLEKMEDELLQARAASNSTMKESVKDKSSPPTDKEVVPKPPDINPRSSS